jgi:hypothetical protein
MDKAQWNELLVYALNRPLAFAVLKLAGHLGAIVRFPGVGHIVNDAAIARRVLTDSERFDSHSPGSLGVLVTQVLGPCALLNMDGPAHGELKRRLTGIGCRRSACRCAHRRSTSLSFLPVKGNKELFMGLRRNSPTGLLRVSHTSAAIACSSIPTLPWQAQVITEPREPSKRRARPPYLWRARARLRSSMRVRARIGRSLS